MGSFNGGVSSRLRRLALAAFAVSLVFQTSCTSLKYVSQAAAGQDDLTRRAREIDDLVREQRVNARMRRLFLQVPTMKKFGESHGLTATRNYTKYVRVEGPAVVWVVSASLPLRFRSKSWTFPLVGSFNALNWFKRSDADAFAADLRKESEGWDVDVRGAGAYSTAGFFDDAVLSSMIPEGKRALGSFANTILHESSHATIFVKHQSTLNESVANFVGDKLAAMYLEETLGPEAPETVAYLDAERFGEERGHEMQKAYLALDELYSSTKSDDEKRAAKSQIIESLRARLGIKRPINNATLIQYKTYNSGQDELAALLVACGNDFRKFVLAVKSLESKAFAKPQDSDVGKMITPLIAGHCAG